jgi:hypothetical protein
VRDALAIGPRNAIDQFEKGNTVPRAADVRGGIEDDRAGSHTSVCSRANHRTGFFLFNAATGFVELASIGPTAPAALLTRIATSGATAFLIIMAMAFGVILPRMLFERLMPSSV